MQATWLHRMLPAVVVVVVVVVVAVVAVVDF